MISRTRVLAARERAAGMFRQAGVHITPQEKERIEIVDFGLSRFDELGMSLLTLVSTERVAVKLLALLPLQTEPEHWHPPMGENPGKEETVRVIWGTVYFYTAGPDTLSEGFVPAARAPYYTLRHERRLGPGDMLTFPPGEKHWFQAGKEGGVLYSFSSMARDVMDGFTDPGIERITRIVDG